MTFELNARNWAIMMRCLMSTAMFIYARYITDTNAICISGNVGGYKLQCGI